jgi:hypothetical protein
MIETITLKTCCCAKEPIQIKEDDPIVICRHCGGARPTTNMAAMRAREYKRRLLYGDSGNS